MNRSVLLSFSISLFLLGSVAHSKTQLNFSSDDGTRLYGEFYQAQDPKAMLLVVHGLQSHSGWYMGGQANAEAGISSLAFDRRGSGLSSGKHGHASSVDDFMDDFAAALSFLESVEPSGLPIHVMANSLGAVIAINYFSQNKDVNIASLILTTPGTHSTEEGSYSLLTKLAILTAPAERYFRSPIRDEHFVDEGNYLDWIRNDPMSRRNFTASFLRTVNSMKKDLDKKSALIDVPVFALVADKDAIIDNAAFEKEVFSNFQSKKVIRTYDSKHYLFFGNDRENVAADIREWVLEN
jgi:alpha-beta hydrolase superfamily lysophospholipase